MDKYDLVSRKSPLLWHISHELKEIPDRQLAGEINVLELLCSFYGMLFLDIHLSMQNSSLWQPKKCEMSLSLPSFLFHIPKTCSFIATKMCWKEVWTVRSILPKFSQTSRKAYLVSFQQWKLELRKLLFSHLLGWIRKDQWQIPSKSREAASTALYKRKMWFIQDKSRADDLCSLRKKTSLHMYFFRS